MNRLLTVVLLPVAFVMGACGKDEPPPPASKAPEVSIPAKDISSAVAALPGGEQGEFVLKLQKDMDELTTSIKDLRTKADGMSGEAKQKLEEQIRKLEEDLQATQLKFAELKSAAGDKWKELQAGMNESIDRLKQSAKQAQGGTS